MQDIEEFLLHWNAVDLNNPPLEEGLHFVVPFQDEVVNIEVRTLKYEKETRSASKDLQTVETTVTVNYHPDRESSKQAIQKPRIRL